MTDYKTIRGKKIKSFATDLDNGQGEGQIFYSETDDNFKTAVASSAWHSGANMTQARYAHGHIGIQTAALAAGGFATTAQIPASFNTVEEYNGTGWTSSPSLNEKRSSGAACGTTSAGLFSGGGTASTSPAGTTVNSEEWNGTAWSEENNMGTSRYEFGFAFGTQTAALAAGGYPNTQTEEYDGSSWSEVTDIPTVISSGGAVGTQIAGLGFGGYSTSASSQVAESLTYDGTSWTDVGDMNKARRNIMCNFGTQTDAYAFGGITPSGTRQADGSSWDGTTWSAHPSSLGTGRFTQSHPGDMGSSSTAGWCSGGNPPANAGSTTSEEFNVTVNTITAGAWSAGGTIPYSAISKNGSGILTAAFVVGGETPPGAMVNDTAEYNGTSWTAGGDINSARGDVMAAGTLPAGLIMGGYQNTGTFLFSEVEEYNGTSWSEVTNMPTGAYSGSGTGTQTAAFVCNMYIGSPGERTNVTYEYDGTNWSNGGNTAETTNSRSAVGTLTAGLAVGGRPAPSAYIDETELYDGTSWTAGVDMISEFQGGGQTSKGTQTDCMIFGSPRSPANTDAFKTDGTTWFTQPSLAVYQNNGTGTSTAALGFGVSNTSVEFAGETTSLNLKTITDS